MLSAISAPVEVSSFPRLLRFFPARETQRLPEPGRSRIVRIPFDCFKAMSHTVKSTPTALAQRSPVLHLLSNPGILLGRLVRDRRFKQLRDVIALVALLKFSGNVYVALTEYGVFGLIKVLSSPAFLRCAQRSLRCAQSCSSWVCLLFSIVS